MDEEFFGLVKGSSFQEYRSDGEQPILGLTSIKPMEARPPESGRLQLAALEARLVVVTGIRHGEWIYGAKVVEEAGPLTSKNVLALLDKTYHGD